MIADVTRVRCLLLAAGEARRYGRPKQLERIDGIALVRRAALAALDAGMEVLVVTGAYADEVEAELSGLPLRCIRNTRWAEGMGSSLACGASQMLAQPEPARAVLIALADQPLVGADELRLLLREHARHPQAIVAADHGEMLGPPCLFPASDLPELAALYGDRGARALLKQHAARLIGVAMPQAALDVDTADDLERAAAAMRSA